MRKNKRSEFTVEQLHFRNRSRRPVFSAPAVKGSDQIEKVFQEAKKRARGLKL